MDGLARPPAQEQAASPDLAKKLRARRREMGLTLKDVAEGSGLSVGFISQIERGEGNPTLDTLNRIGRAFGLTLGFVPKRTPRA